MKFKDLPPIKDLKPVDFSYFPSLFYAAVFRFWEMAPKERIAAALYSSFEEIEEAAALLGVPPQ